MSRIVLLFTFFGILLASSAHSPLFGQLMPFESNAPKPQFDPQEKKKKSIKKNPLSNKSFAQLKEGKTKALEKKDLPSALKHLDAMRIACTDNRKNNDHEAIKDILLEMGQLYVQLEDWTKGEKAYSEFILLYPSAAQCDFAHYQAIVCGFNLTLTPDRDQTKTQEVIDRASKFVIEYPKSSHLPQVTTLLTQAREKLLESEIGIFNFHLHSKHYKAAQLKIESITQEHITYLPAQEPKALELTIQLAQAQNNQREQLKAQLALGQKFPEHEITKKLVTDLPAIEIQLASLEPKLLGHPSTGSG